MHFTASAERGSVNKPASPVVLLRTINPLKIITKVVYVKGEESISSIKPAYIKFPFHSKTMKLFTQNEPSSLKDKQARLGTRSNQRCLHMKQEKSPQSLQGTKEKKKKKDHPPAVFYKLCLKVKRFLDAVCYDESVKPSSVCLNVHPPELSK